MVNTIWGLKKRDGEVVNTFEGLAAIGIEHFRDLFKP